MAQTEFLGRNRLLYMDLADLRELQRRVEDKVELEKLRRSPLYVGLEEEEDPLDLHDLEARYADRRTGLDRDYYLTKRATASSCGSTPPGSSPT